MLHFALSSILKGTKMHFPLISALKAAVLIKNDSSTSEESKAKKPFVNISYVGQLMSI